MGKLIDADRLKDIIDYAILANVPADAENTKEEKWNDWIQTVIDRQPTVEAIQKADYAARLKADTTEKFKEFRDKLSKWMFHNSESVCGCSMIDIDYLEGHMDELLYELGIYEVNDGTD